jgi:uncharacterized protein (TIGR03067 family)
MPARAALALVLLPLLAAADPAPDAKQEADKLQGEWTMVSLETRGRKSTDEAVKGYRLTIRGDRWEVTRGGAAAGGDITFKLDPSKDPKEIDLVTKSRGAESVSRGIYKLEGDTLTLCRTQGTADRPKEFKTTPEAGVLVVWKRDKK